MAIPKHDENPWAEALCRQFDPDMWFLAEESLNLNGEPLDEITLALKLCNECPLREQCLVAGMDYADIKFGIWGGLLAGERMQLAGMNKYSAERNIINKARGIRRMSRVKRKPASPAAMDAARETAKAYERMSGNYGRADWRIQGTQKREV